MVTIAIANQKGGTGKTTTAVTLAHRLAQQERRVLVVDTDVQGNVACALGLDKAPGIYRMVQVFQGVERAPLIANARPNLDVVASDKTTEQAKRVLVGLDFRERILADVLAALDYDAAIVDCAPSVDVLHVAALVAADWLIVPTQLDHLALDGVNEVLTSLAQLKQQAARAPNLLGILPTFHERRTKETLVQLKRLAATYGRFVLQPIPEDVKLREAPAFGKTIWEYAPQSRGVVGVVNGNGQPIGGYAQFVERVTQTVWEAS
jgi:chromosome partitioning protein